MDGLLSIDKPAGMTSHDVVNQVRRVSRIRRVGHAGTLDPLATGVLLLCLGRATRLIEYLMGQPKVYEAVVRLGQSTNTYDADGELVDERPVDVTELELRAALEPFQGAIEQVPPMFSAIKRGGQPLYKLARQGIEVEREPRPVTIYELALLGWELPSARLRVRCSAGTYIRSLAHDLGQALGTGGHLTALRRTAVGAFRVQDAASLATLTIENLTDYLQPADAAVAHLPRLELASDEAARLQQGQRVARSSSQPEAELVRAYDPSGTFIGVIAAEGPAWQARKILVTG